ncbi:uncharacterized protein LY89DRAFT_790056 [Mollisia scopiformis]|uniref:Glucose-methanol-choline oxidoreductase N-terminal domain-containing protein n=1 Tax=Mollisia scopiformis TaxID=149040 RepID=A0A132B4P4_MOLSC|nr:uncharacterized protein LY89DRAFT_790056 [Mollisia scopiformis]KUJ06959.1 hypothetical protein LY89DRAFT_790056 [Mollisia scopiformis]
MSNFALALLLFSFLLALAAPLHINPRDFDAPFLDCYDYIIVGGGVSGLVVANRLTEDPNSKLYIHFTVLVLEAGPLDDYEDFIMFPIEDGYGLGTEYDWNLWTAPQTFLDGASRPYDMGRGIGGGSLINGMCWTRGGSADYDAWKALGNDGWGWDDLLPYFQKECLPHSFHFINTDRLQTENYTDNVDADFSRELYIQPNISTHGTSGYVHVAYPRYFYNQSQLFLDGLQELGIPILTDPNNGTAAGGMLIPDSIHPDNQTRSYARLDYFDGFINRPNLHVTTHQHVTRVLVSVPHNLKGRDYPAGFWISGVEFVTDGSLTLHNVSCSREVILAAGAVHTPQILELSGIGSEDILNQFDIPVIINLPGVGNNFQDHPYVGVVYYFDNTSYVNIDMIENNPGLDNQAAQEYYANKTGPWTAGAINTVAFPSLPSISQNWTNMMTDASSQNTTLYLIPGLDRTVIAGYDAQKTILTDLLSRRDVGAYELLNDNIGLLAVAAMHPFSRGSVHIQSTNPYMQPLIDPRYCSNPLDCQVLVEALLFNNQLINTTSMRLLSPTPYYPFFQGATRDSLMPAISIGIRTEFHGTGSTSMMPLDLGGVVDTHLRVYGTKNLRIVDAGIQPLVPAAHLQAPVYAVAEKAADIIKADNSGLVLSGCGANSGFAGQGPVIANHSIISSTSSSVLVPSTFPEFLNSSVLSSMNTAQRSANPTSPLSLASGAVPDQLPVSSGVNTNAIKGAVSVFLNGAGILTSPPFLLSKGFVAPLTFPLQPSTVPAVPTMSLIHRARGASHTRHHAVLKSSSPSHRTTTSAPFSPTTFDTRHISATSASGVIAETPGIVTVKIAAREKEDGR